MLNKIIEDDLKRIAKSEFLDFSLLKNQTILITGATGFIGKLLVMSLLYINKIYDLNLKILAYARDENKAKEIFKDFLDDKNLEIFIQDILQEINLKENVDFIIHAASPTDSKFFILYPVKTIEYIVNGTDNILKFALNNKIKSFVYLSSMEIYGVIDQKITTEADCGFLEILQSRSSYPQAKRLAETLCFAYKSQFNLPVKIARLSQIFGAGVEYDDKRVLSEFVRNIIEKKDIVLLTKGQSIITNCYISDAIAGILLVLLKGENGEAYNIANSKNIFSIKEIAEFLVKKYPTSKLIFDIKDTPKYRPDSVLKLDTKKLENLGFKAKVDFKEMIERTILSFQGGKNEK